MALIQIVSFFVRWVGAFAVAVAAMVAALLAIAVVPALIFGSENEEILSLARNWTALFWFAVFLMPLVAAIALPFAAGFSLVAELNGIEVHAGRYAVLGAGAGLIVGWLTTAQVWAGHPPLDFAVAGGLGGWLLGALHWGRFELVPRRKAPEHEL
jgi:hypothetical protein